MRERKKEIERLPTAMNSLHVRKLVSPENGPPEKQFMCAACERVRGSDNIRVFAFVQHTIRSCGC